MARYIIRGGLEGKKRLEVVGRTMWPTTWRLLREAGLAPGMKCLDLGSGGGDVTLELAKLVGPAGHVTGLDMDEAKLDIARASAAQRQLTNVEFRNATVEDWSEEARYDFVYCRFVLTHLADPLKTLQQMRQAVRPGGTIAVEDIDKAGSFCHPPDPAFAAYVRLYRAAAARAGADADIGPKLHGMMLDADWQDVHVNVVQPVFAAGEGKQIPLLTLINIADSLLRERIVSETELDAAVEGLRRFTDDPRSLISLPRVFQLWARRG